MIKLYDTRRRQKVDFEPVEPGKVSMYVCGPTVYNRHPTSATRARSSPST